MVAVDRAGDGLCAAGASADDDVPRLTYLVNMPRVRPAAMPPTQPPNAAQALEAGRTERAERLRVVCFLLTVCPQSEGKNELMERW